MKKFILAAFLAVPLAAVAQQKAAAQCTDLPKWLRYKLCTCLSEKSGKGGHGCGLGGCANGSCGAGGGCYRQCGSCGCGCFLLGCNTSVPGPWYLYWPYNGQTLEMAGYGTAWPGGWDYEYHFRTPSPWGYPAPAVAFPSPPMAPGMPESP